MARTTILSTSEVMRLARRDALEAEPPNLPMRPFEVRQATPAEEAAFRARNPSYGAGKAVFIEERVEEAMAAGRQVVTSGTVPVLNAWGVTTGTRMSQSERLAAAAKEAEAAGLDPYGDNDTLIPFGGCARLDGRPMSADDGERSVYDVMQVLEGGEIPEGFTVTEIRRDMSDLGSAHLTFAVTCYWPDCRDIPARREIRLIRVMGHGDAFPASIADLARMAVECKGDTLLLPAPVPPHRDGDNYRSDVPFDDPRHYASRERLDAFRAGDSDSVTLADALAHGFIDLNAHPGKLVAVPKPQPIDEAFATLKEAMQVEAYAWTWLCNMAVPLWSDKHMTHEEGTRAAARQMESLFCVDVTATTMWADFEARWKQEKAEQAPRPGVKPAISMPVADVGGRSSLVIGSDT